MVKFKNEMTKLQKNIDKTQSTHEIEQKILIFKKYRYANIIMNNEHDNYFVLIDNSEFKENTISKVDEWLQILGDSLKVIANRELKSIKNDIDNYEKALGGEMGAIDQLRSTKYLNGFFILPEEIAMMLTMVAITSFQYIAEIKTALALTRRLQKCGSKSFLEGQN